MANEALYRNSTLLGQLIIARRPEWEEVELRTDGTSPPNSVKDPPSNALAGVHLSDSPKTRVLVDLREDLARYGTRVRVTTVDDSATYTVTIDGLAYDYAASSGDGAQEILEGLRDAINDGVSLGSITCSFADANPDTVTRSSGDWTADNVGGDTQLLFANAAGLNDGLIVTAAGVTATVVTAIDPDEVQAETTVAYTVTARQQVFAEVEERDDVWTLVVHTRLGVDQADTISGQTGTALDSYLEALADETVRQTVAVSSTGTGELEYDQDATQADLVVYSTAKGKNPPAGWRSPNELQFAGLTDLEGFDERISSAGCERFDIGITNTDGVVARAYLGPAVQEDSN